MKQELFCDETFDGSKDCLCGLDLDLSCVEWKRPQELGNNPSMYIKNGISEPLQGKLGNCWLISVCHILSKNEKLLQSIFIDCQHEDFKSQSYDGKWSVCLWDCNKDTWVKVIVDDRFPTINNELIFGSNKDKSQFWLPLLEKACAKFHGGYHALCSGQVSEAFMLLTAGYSWRKALSNRTSEHEIDVLKQQIKVFTRHQTELSIALSFMENNVSGSFDQCSEIEKEVPALVPMHYYVVVNVHSSGSDDQIELWNPWSNPVDSETVFIPLCKLLQLKPTVTFSAVKMHHVLGCDERNYFEKSIFGGWRATLTCGGKFASNTFAKNPQYAIVFERQLAGLAYVSLVQSNKRKYEKRNSLHQAIGLHIWKIPLLPETRMTDLSLKTNPPDFKTNPSYQYKGDVSVFCVIPSEKTHLLVIPSTYSQGINQSYLLRICSSLPFCVCLLNA